MSPRAAWSPADIVIGADEEARPISRADLAVLRTEVAHLRAQLAERANHDDAQARRIASIADGLSRLTNIVVAADMAAIAPAIRSLRGALDEVMERIGARTIDLRAAEVVDIPTIDEMRAVVGCAEEEPPARRATEGHPTGAASEPFHGEEAAPPKGDTSGPARGARRGAAQAPTRTATEAAATAGASVARSATSGAVAGAPGTTRAKAPDRQPSPFAERNAEILRLFEEGLSRREIAKAISVRESIVNHTIAKARRRGEIARPLGMRAGVERSKDDRAERDRKILDLWSVGRSHTEIQAELRLTSRGLVAAVIARARSEGDPRAIARAAPGAKPRRQAQPTPSREAPAAEGSVVDGMVALGNAAEEVVQRTARAKASRETRKAVAAAIVARRRAPAPEKVLPASASRARLERVFDAAPKAAAQEATDLRAEDTAAGVPFLEAGRTQCRWPLWSGAERTGLVCGAPVVSEACAYCARHAAQAFVPVRRHNPAKAADYFTRGERLNARPRPAESGSDIVDAIRGGS